MNVSTEHDKEVKQLNIALDYDETFTEAPVLFKAFVELFKTHGHKITFVTFRSNRGDNSDIEADANDLDIDIVFTCGRQKQHVFKADIWIDDSPETIVSAKKLGNMYDGCLANNDMD